MGYCPADCVGDPLTDMPQDCNVQPRKRNVDKIGFFQCTTDIPSPLSCEAYQALIAGGDLVFSNSIASAEFGDPQFTAVQMSECLPAQQLTTGRQLTVDDKIAVTIPAEGETPAIPYFDYAWWKNKKQASATLRMGILYCDGTFEVMKDENGNPMPFTFTLYRVNNRDNAGSDTQAPLIIEIKRGIFNFAGDPLQFDTPELDTTTCD